MKIRLYLDEDSMEDALVKGLRSHGLDVLTAFEARTLGYSDEEQLEFATSQGRVLCTVNVGDFYSLHGRFRQADRNHTGILLVAQQIYSVGEQVRRILNLGARKSAEDMQNQAEFLSAWDPE